MTLQELLSHLQNEQKIVVLGLQRSGTHIAAEILGYELEYATFSEKDFAYTSCVQGEQHIDVPITEFVKEHDQFVLQAPALLHAAHTLDLPNVTVVFISRSADEIRASRERSNWPGEQTELAKYDIDQFKDYFRTDFDLVDKQITIWNDYSKPQLQRVLEIPFSAFAHHKFWLKQKERASLPIGSTQENGNWITYRKTI